MFFKMNCIVLGIIWKRGELEGAGERRENFRSEVLKNRQREMRSEGSGKVGLRQKRKEGQVYGPRCRKLIESLSCISRTGPGPGHITGEFSILGRVHSISMRFHSTTWGKLILFFPWFPPTKHSCSLCGFLTRLQHGHCMLMRQRLVQSQALVSE